jgi:tetratricopeptide (TPR) repeat protein
MDRRIMKYNPAFLSKEELIERFVVRHAELDLIVQAIRENTGPSNQHLLVIGPRGIGKTVLVLRAVEEVRRQKDLSDRWYPLVFAEESYQVTTPGEFWLEAIFHLAQKTHDPKWRAAHEELRKESDETRLRERALAQLLDFADAQQKRLLLVVENLNMLLGDQMADEDGWVLRSTLLHEPRIMLLTTATSRFEQIENTDKAMFELFRVIGLEPLSQADCRRMWASISGEEPTDNRIRPVQILTGGNPRLVAIISSFGARMSFHELMTDLMQLVDDHTEYFKSHLDGIATTERKVYLALVELWDPVGARDVAKAARLDVNKASALLRRLVERGAVVELIGKGRKKLYQVAERMYNIYYLMRRHGAPSQRVRAVVNFMIAFYSETELVDAVRRIAEEACTLEPDTRMDHYLAYEELLRNASISRIWEVVMQTTPNEFLSASDVPPSLRERLAVQTAPPPIKLADLPEKIITEYTEAGAMFREATVHAERHEYDRAISIYDELVGRFGEVQDAVLTLMISTVLINKSIVLNRQGRHAEEKQAEREAIHRTAEAKRRVAELRAAVDIFTQITALSEKGKYVEADPLCDEMVGRFANAQELDVLDVVALALTVKAEGLGGKKEHEEALRCYDKILKMLRGRRDMWSVKRTVSALVDKGHTLEKLDKSKEAMICYDRAIRHSCNSADSGLRAAVACASLAKGTLLCRQHQCAAATEAFEKALDSDPSNYGAALKLAECFEARGQDNQAVELVGTYFARSEKIKMYVRRTTDVIIRLAAKGFAKPVLTHLQGSPSAEPLEPLLVGLRLYLGEEVVAAAEIMEVAKDVVKRIEDRRVELESLPRQSEEEA